MSLQVLEDLFTYVQNAYPESFDSFVKKFWTKYNNGGFKNETGNIL